MDYTLRFTFGGLCLLVEEPKAGGSIPAGFYVILPKSSSMPHVPTLFYRAKYLGGSGSPPTGAGGNKWHCKPLSPGDVDLTKCAAPGVGGTTMPARFARMSHYGGSNVDPSCFAVRTGSCVVNVIKLPLLQRPIEPYGDQAQIITSMSSMAGAACIDWITGLARTEYDVTHGGSLSIQGVSLVPRNGLLEVVIGNIPEVMPGMPGAMTSAVGSEVMHARAYYDLLQNAKTQGSNNGPRMFVFANSAGGSWITIGCSGSKTDLVPPWIQPEECTVGIGCPPSNPNC